MKESLQHVDLAARTDGMPGFFGPWRQKLWRGERGSSLVEVAISSSIVFMLFFGVIQLGYALYTYQFVNEVARELTRYSVVRGDQCGGGMPNCGFTSSTTLQSYAQSNFNYPGLPAASLSVSVAWYSPSTYAAANPTWSACSGSGCNAPGNLVKVSVQYPYTLSVPFLKSTLLQVKSSSSMIISQ